MSEKSEFDLLLASERAARERICHLEKEVERLNAKYKSKFEEVVQLVAFYQGEGEDEVPEEKEWKRLARISAGDRTEEQRKRLRYLAHKIQTDLDANLQRGRADKAEAEVKRLRAEIDRLKRKLAEGKAECIGAAMNRSEDWVSVTTQEIIAELQYRCNFLLMGYREKGSKKQMIIRTHTHGEEIGDSLFALECLRCEVMQIETGTYKNEI